MSQIPAEARPASTVIVLRPAAGEAFEVLLLRRNDKVAFMAGAYVFPGGRVDAGDRDVAADAAFLSRPPRFADISTADELPYRAAAIREVAEEASLTIAVDDLLPIAHWVTPEIEIRRYDTRFFLAVQPDGQEARHDGGETTALLWLEPFAAIEQCRRGDIRLPPPTWTTLRQLERLPTLEAALEWARTVRIVQVMPGFEKGEHESMLTLPGDPLHPTIDGWIVPEETRFILTEGAGWMPTRP